MRSIDRSPVVRVHVRFTLHLSFYLGVVEVLILHAEEPPHGSPEKLAHDHVGGNHYGQRGAVYEGERVVPWRDEGVQPVEPQQQVHHHGSVVHLFKVSGNEEPWTKWRRLTEKYNNVVKSRKLRNGFGTLDDREDTRIHPNLRKAPHPPLHDSGNSTANVPENSQTCQK